MQEWISKEKKEALRQKHIRQEEIRKIQKAKDDNEERLEANLRADLLTSAAEAVEGGDQNAILLAILKVVSNMDGNIKALSVFS